jgi:HEPN domain-containing protein
MQKIDDDPKSCMNELTKEWVDKAEADFYSADLLLHAGEHPISEPACFHCQQ